LTASLFKNDSTNGTITKDEVMLPKPLCGIRKIRIRKLMLRTATELAGAGLGSELASK
jgi:hypothetical protein